MRPVPVVRRRMLFFDQLTALRFMHTHWHYEIERLMSVAICNCTRYSMVPLDAHIGASWRWGRSSQHSGPSESGTNGTHSEDRASAFSCGSSARRTRCPCLRRHIGTALRISTGSILITGLLSLRDPPFPEVSFSAHLLYPLPPSCSLCAFPLERLYWKPIQSLWTENLDERKLSSAPFQVASYQ